MPNGNDPFGAPIPLKKDPFGPAVPVTPASAIASGASLEDIQAATQREAKGEATGYRVVRMAPLEPQSLDTSLRNSGHLPDPDSPQSVALDKQVTFAPHIYHEQAAPGLDAVQDDYHKLNNAAGVIGGGAVLGPLAEAAGEVPAVRGAVNAIGNTMRTEKGALRPGVRLMSRVGGAALGHYMGVPEGGLIGALAGPSLVDAMAPASEFSEQAKIGAFMNRGYRPVGEGGSVTSRIGEPAESVAGTRSLVLSPEEAATEDRMQGIAKKRASERGMQFAGGMTPREGRSVPRYPTRFGVDEAPQPREVIKFGATTGLPPSSDEMLTAPGRIGEAGGDVGLGPRPFITAKTLSELPNETPEEAAQRRYMSAQIRRNQQQ